MDEFSFEMVTVPALLWPLEQSMVFQSLLQVDHGNDVVKDANK